jgi:polysaccharide export outer membrane protein
MTILDALSLSGDLTSDGRRSNIKIIRQVGEKKVVTLMDMSNLDVFKSETYYLKSNDIVYVETLPKKFLKENTSYLTLTLGILNLLFITVSRVNIL